jgi:hypothetical protein
MANPSLEVYMAAKHALVYVAAFPITVMWGGPGCTSLEASASPPLPFSDRARDFSLHKFSDSNVDVPSITGGVMMLAGGAIESLCQSASTSSLLMRTRQKWLQQAPACIAW